MGLQFYSFGLLPCVRVRCGLYPHGFTILLFWLAPKRESPLRTDPHGLTVLSFGLLPCVRVRYGLYSHEFTILLIWFAPLCESSLRTVSTWAFCFTLLVCSFV